MNETVVNLDKPAFQVIRLVLSSAESSKVYSMKAH